VEELVLAEVRAASEQVEQVVSTLDVDVLEPALASEYVAAFAELERVCAAGKALAARRVVATGAWSRQGAHRRAADWLASVSGTSIGQAASELETVQRLTELPATEAALRAGELSTQQVKLVADAATADPHAEGDLLSHAATNGVAGLRRECGRVTAAARHDEVAHHQRIHAQRHLRSFTDDHGAGCIEIRGPLDATATILAALKPIEAELFAQAHQADRTERQDALAFDALVELARRGRTPHEGSPRCGSDAHVSVRIDHSALVRGHTEPGEVCEIVGLGPVPVAVVSQMLDDAALWNLERLCGHHHRHKHLHDLRLEGTGTDQHFVDAADWAPPGPDP
jgi:hypothetical protein